MSTPDPAVALEAMQSRHYRIPDPSIAADVAGICESDRRRWPCHAHLALAAAGAVLELHQPRPIYGLADDGNGKSLCGHPFGTDTDAHFEADDGYWYCRDKRSGSRCSSCADEEAADLWEEWPCPTVQALTRELNGESRG